MWRLYAYYDLVSEEFGFPCCYRNDKVAVRSFLSEFDRQAHEASKRPDAPPLRSPSEFELYSIGKFDYETGALSDIERRKVPLIVAKFDDLTDND